MSNEDDVLTLSQIKEFRKSVHEKSTVDVEVLHEDHAVTYGDRCYNCLMPGVTARYLLSIGLFVRNIEDTLEISPMQLEKPWRDM